METNKKKTGPEPKYGPRKEIHVFVPIADLEYTRKSGNVTEWIVQAIKQRIESERARDTARGE